MVLLKGFNLSGVLGVFYAKISLRYFFLEFFVEILHNCFLFIGKSHCKTNFYKERKKVVENYLILNF